MKLTVVGTGYVGLVTGVCLADTGNTVTCVDRDADKIAKLEAGQAPFFEPGLSELMKKNVAERRLRFTTNLPRAVAASEIVFIAVGTPQDEHGAADLSQVFAVADVIGQSLTGFTVIVDKSTVPVGTSQQVHARIAAQTTQRFVVASNPEFLKQGAAIADFMKPDRVVVGCEDREATRLLKQLYRPFTRTGAPILLMSPESAEMTKYVANAMLASRISFMNEVANICERVGANVDDVRHAIGLDERIGNKFLFPGIGYGGSCFPKDVQALQRFAEAAGCGTTLLAAVHQVNADQWRSLSAKIFDHFDGDLEGKHFGVWGLSFKPRTDDMREAPSIRIIHALQTAGASVHAYDPEAMPNAKKIFGESIRFATHAFEALEDADALLVLTEWNEFRWPDFDRIRDLLHEPVIFDGRNVYDPSVMREYGFQYYGIGR